MNTDEKFKNLYSPYLSIVIPFRNDNYSPNAIEKLNFSIDVLKKQLDDIQLEKMFSGVKTFDVDKSKIDEFYPLKYFYDWIKNWRNFLKNKKDFLQMDYSKLVDSKQNYIDEILNYLDIDEKNFEIISKKLERNHAKKIDKLDIQLNLAR